MAQSQVLGPFWNQLAESRLLSAAEWAGLEKVRSADGALADADLAALLVERGLLSRYQADRLLEGRARGFFFDQYKVIDVLGVGGMGWVYQAENTETGDVVALKVLQDQLKHDAGMQARFLQEARVGLRLVHPHIVRTHVLGAAGGLPYMVMDFVRGPSLLEVLQRCGPLKWGHACEFARQAALGLDYAHHSGVIHRDVKPQNLLIDGQGHVRLLDFGLSMVKEGEHGDEFSMAMIFGHESVGTAEFSAPEQALDSLAADARSDVYSLGGTLYMALTGRTPFEGKTVIEMLRAHRTQKLRSVRELNPKIPQGVADVVAKMLQKDPAQRFATAAEAADALAPWSKTGPVTFDFDSILNERKRIAQQKLAQLSKARSTPSGLIGSTAKPTTISSVTSGSTSAVSPGAAASRSGVSSAMSESANHSELIETVPVASPQVANPHRRAGQPIESSAVLSGLDTPRTVPLKLDQLLLGRREDCDVVIRDNAVSARHCELRFDGFHWWLTDLNSRNGTFVNGAPARQQQLRDGDVIQLGVNVRLRLDATGKETVQAAPRRGPGVWIWLTVAVVFVGLILALAAWWSGLV